MTVTDIKPRSRVARIAFWLLTAVWALLTVIYLVGAWSPAYPNAPLLSAGLLSGLLYPFFTVGVVVGVVLAVVLGRRRRLVGTIVVGVLTVALAAGVALPTGSMLRLAAQENVDLSLAQLVQGAGAGTPAPSRTVPYREVDGQALQMDVWRPADQAVADKAGNPAFVYVFGGGFVGGTRADMSELFQHLTSEGFTVFAGDYRLATSDHPTYDKAPGDVRCGLGWVFEHAAEYGVDSSRVVMSGASAGANLALNAAYTTDEPAPADCYQGDSTVAAMVDFYGPADLASLHDESPSADASAFLEQYLGGTPTELAARYAAKSVLTKVRAGLPPTLLLHGTKDGMVPTEQSTTLAQALSDADVPNKLVLFPWQQHGFDLVYGTLANQIAVVEIDRFLTEHLG